MGAALGGLFLFCLRLFLRFGRLLCFGGCFFSLHLRHVGLLLRSAEYPVAHVPRHLYDVGVPFFIDFQFHTLRAV